VLLLALALPAACAIPEPTPTKVAQATTVPTVAAPAPTVPPAVPTATATVRPATPTPSPTATARPTASTDWADFVFVWDGNLWLASGDGARQLQLTSDGGYSSPRWSPDGTRIAFVQGQELKAEIGVMDADGHGKRLFTNDDAADAGPVWSPRGDTIAYTRTADTSGDGRIDQQDEAEVWLVNADGGSPRRLAAGRDPAWAPEGLRLAFATNGTLDSAGPWRTNNGIHVINTKGQNEWTLVSVANLPADLQWAGFPFHPGTTLLKQPVWSPDGSRLAFTSNGHSGLVASISVKATDLRIHDLNYEGGFGRVVFSPAGDALAYESLPPSGLAAVVTADLDGKRLGAVGGAKQGLSVVQPAWSPDGTRLLFTQQEAEPYLGVANADGSGAKALFWGRANSAEWAPAR